MNAKTADSKLLILKYTGDYPPGNTLGGLAEINDLVYHTTPYWLENYQLACLVMTDTPNGVNL